MALDVVCPNCGHHMILKFVGQGETAGCSQCAATVTVPADAAEVHVSDSEYLRSRGIEASYGASAGDLYLEGQRADRAVPSRWSRMHPLLAVFFDPSETVRAIVSQDPNKFFYLLSGLWSIILSLAAVAAVMRFSTVRALVTILCGGVFILCCIIIQVVLWSALTG